MAKGIEKLVLQRFRGATTSTVLEFDPKKMVVMLFGENGTGKSTIIDAIDLVCNGVAGSIQRPSVRIKEHLPALGASISDVAIELKCDGTTWNATHDGRQVRLDREDATPVAHILRRSQLLRLIDSEPGKRYDEMKRFIDVGGVEDCENALKNAVSQAQSRSNSTARLQVEEATALEDLWQAETTASERGSSALDWAAAKSNASVKQLEAEVSALSVQLDALQNVTSALNARRQARQNDDATAHAFKTAQDALESVATRIGDEKLVELLQNAESWLSAQSEAAQCPVCEQGVSVAGLKIRLQERLGSLRALKEASAEVSRTRARHTSSRNALKAAEDGFNRALGKLIEVAPDLKVPEASEENEAAWQELETQGAQWQARYDAAQRDVNQFNAIKQLHDRVLKTRFDAAEAVALEKRLKDALEIVRQQRHAYTGKILATISAECNRLYALIHPDEPVGDFDIQLNENKRASLQQQARFQSHEGVIPQAYFSESHLDTLGFCLFLALAKHQSGEDAIIVLDDVFTSVDSRHLRRIIGLLSTEADSFRQIIITTHYRNWRDQYRYLSGSTSVVELMELHNWSLSGGVRKTNSGYATDELRQHIEAELLNRQAVASLAGVLMEAALDHLALLYGCGLPRRAEGTYTLGELSDAVNKVSKHLNVEHAPANGKNPRVVTASTALKPVLDAIKSLTFIRNQVGSHFNLSGADICDDDVREFAQKSLQLLETLACPQCGVPAVKPKDDFFKCDCGHTRLKPLKIA